MKLPEFFCISQYLEYHASIFPEKQSFIIVNNNGESKREITFLQLSEKVNSLFLWLKKSKIKSTKALLLFEDTINFIIAFTACQKLGIVAVPASIQWIRRNQMTNSPILGSETGFILSESKLSKKISELNTKKRTVFVDLVEGDVKGTEYTYKTLQKGAISFIQYTSGSLSKPKGVIIAKSNLISNQKMIETAFQCNSESVIFSWLPFYHDMGLVGNLLHAIYVGCTCITMPPIQFLQRPISWLEIISKYKVTHSGGPNFAYEMCLNHSLNKIKQIDLSSWRVAYNGSEPIRHDLFSEFHKKYKRFGFSFLSCYPCYGLAEATLLVTAKEKSSALKILYLEQVTEFKYRVIKKNSPHISIKHVISSGRVVEGVEIKVIRSSSKENCLDLEKGEICIAGQNVTNGYYDESSQNLFYTIGGKIFLRTGDMGFMYRQQLYVLGRIKETLLIRGINYYPADIEYEIKKNLPSIKEVAVININELNDFIVIVELNRESSEELSLQKAVYNVNSVVINCIGISPYDIVVTSHNSIPKTSSGKKKRIQAKIEYEKGFLRVLVSKRQFSSNKQSLKAESLTPYNLGNEHSYDTIRIYLISLVSAISGQETGDLNDGNLKLSQTGLDSIKVVELINRINNDFSICLEISNSLYGSTIDEIVSHIENLVWLKNADFSQKQIII